MSLPNLVLPLLFCCLILTNQSPLEVGKTLPQLKNDTHPFRAHDPINVTMREQFAIGVPQFDIQSVPDDFKVFEVTQEKFINMIETLEKHQNEEQATKTRKQVDQSIFECAVRRPSMEIVKTLNVFTQKPSNKFSFSSEKSSIFVPIRSRQLLYTLDTATLELQVYHFTPQKMNFLSSVKINTVKSGQKITMASSADQEHVYIFSSEGMWSIATKTVLTNVQKLSEGLGGFDSMTNPVDKIYHGAYNFIFALKRHAAVYLIPEFIGANSTYITINKYGNIPLIPQDLYVNSKLLYILDMHEGIFVYDIRGTGDIIEYDHISWRSYGNLEINAKEFSLFVRYLDQEEQKIVELNYHPEKHEANLVRYYKSDRIVFGMSVQTVPVFSSQRAYAMNEPFIFLVTDNGEIQIYPYNVDPRIIRSVHNGVKMHVEGVSELMYLYEDLYLIVTFSSLLYVRIRIDKPELVCAMRESTGHIYYQIQFSSNISSCQNYDPSFQHKVRYNSNCKLVANYMIYVDDPDLSRFQKALLYGVVFLVVAIFIVGLLCLIQWRNNQLSLIGRIKDEIIKLRDRYRKMQPFTEEEPEHPKNQVEFQLPQALPIPDPSS